MKRKDIIQDVFIFITILSSLLLLRLIANMDYLVGNFMAITLAKYLDRRLKENRPRRKDKKRSAKKK